MLSRQMYECVDCTRENDRGRKEDGEAEAEGQRVRRQLENRIRSKWRTLDAVYKAKDDRHVSGPASVLRGQRSGRSAHQAGHNFANSNFSIATYDENLKLQSPLERYVIDSRLGHCRLISNSSRLNRLRSCSYPEPHFDNHIKNEAPRGIPPSRTRW